MEVLLALLLAKLRAQRRVASRSILRLLGTGERGAKSTVLGTFALSMNFINVATERIPTPGVPPRFRVDVDVLTIRTERRDDAFLP